jgi:Co/Zn/Cd efflux system component
MLSSREPDQTLRHVVRAVALFNLGYFGVEFAVAFAIGSVSLFADSIDFLEDASVNLLIFMALGWSLRRRSQIGMLLAGILLIPGSPMHGVCRGVCCKGEPPWNHW